MSAMLRGRSYLSLILASLLVFAATPGHAVTKKLIDQGRLPRDESIVVSITGNGYKTLESVLDTLESPYRIPARLADFDALYERLNGGLEATAI